MISRKLQVFISSTFTDMRAERQAAVEAILSARHIPAGMELFAAGDESQLETIRHWIDESDVFMLILGGRYGSIEPKSGRSYIELEYEYATEKKKPFFAAVIERSFLDAKVKADGANAIETANGPKMEAFHKLVTSKTCRFFSNVEQVKLIAFESLSKYQSREDLAGWVRGSDVIDPKPLLDEIARLRAENESLRHQINTRDLNTEYNFSAIDETQTSKLSGDAEELLGLAASKNGYISYQRFSGGASMQAGGRNLVNPPDNHREEARWKSALAELEQESLVEDLGFEGQTFRLTKKGYEAADTIAVRRATADD